MVNLSIKRISGFFFLFSIATTLSVFSASRKPQVTIKTVPQGIHALNMIINTAPYLDSVNVPAYEKENAPTMIGCAKVLYDNARGQILDALSEIDNRIAYWQYQKDHPWNYFVSKNPLKWVTGPKQEDEVENNLDTLKSHQGELYVLLGQLSELGVVFTKGYKDIFLTDYHKGYEWIDALLNALVRLKTKEISADTSAFIVRAQKLRAQLERVNQFKNDLISDISETEIPSYIARNWLKAGTALFGLNYGYQNYSTQMLNALTVGQQKGQEYLINPVAATFKDVLTPGWRKSAEEEKTILPHIDLSLKTKKELTLEYVDKMGEKYKLQEDAQTIRDFLINQDQFLQNDSKITKEQLTAQAYSLYEKFVEKVGEKELAEFSFLHPNVSVANIKDFVNTMKDYAQGLIVGGKLEAAQQLYDLAKYAYAQKEQYEKQYEAIGKLILLIPAALATGGIYTGYQKLTTKSYGPLRRALVDINSLFIDPSQPLNDEQYGKMIYLVHMLKKRAAKELPVKKNTRADFIADLEKIESPELSVASKRAVIEDMFKKYAFLGLIQSKS